MNRSANIFQNPEIIEDDINAWNEWKANALTVSQEIFCKRNRWFSFSKEEIFNNLKDEVRVPKVLFQGKAGSSLSSAFKNMNYPNPKWIHIVVKQLKGHSSKEVKVLSYDLKKNHFYDHLWKGVYSLSDLDEWVRSSDYLIEEALFSSSEPIPFDFKVYIKCGVVKSVLVIDRNAGKPVFTYVSAKDWQIIPFNEVFAYKLTHWDEGTSLSQSLRERCQTAAKTALTLVKVTNAEDLFVSYDMYVVGSNVYLGEITPRPGAIHANKLSVDFIKYLLV